MRKILLILLTCLFATFAFSQSFPKKQILIPLNNVNGVPFYKDQELSDIVVNGFEVDAKGNFYFFGGKLPCLAVFNGTKQVYRKTYKELGSGTELHFFQDYFYNFAFNSKGDQVFVRIRMADGALSIINNPLVLKHFVAHAIIDSYIILQIPAKDSDGFIFEKYDLSGKLIGKAPNEYNIDSRILPEKDAEFLGMWNGNYVFWNLDFGTGDSQYQIFWVIDKTGKILAKKSLVNRGNIFGRIYAENPSEHRKIRNGNLYVLGRSRTSNDALITEVPLQTFFYK